MEDTAAAERVGLWRLIVHLEAVVIVGRGLDREESHEAHGRHGLESCMAEEARGRRGLICPSGLQLGPWYHVSGEKAEQGGGRTGAPTSAAPLGSGSSHKIASTSRSGASQRHR